MKYCIDGGGYFPDIKDYAKRQEQRKTYLEHCRRVVKDNNVRSRDYLIAQLKTDVEKAIATEYSSRDDIFKGILERYTSAIFKSWEESDECKNISWFSRKNCLQAVNTVSLQIVVLFTLASVEFGEPELIKQIDDELYGESLQDLYRVFVRGDWKNYEYAKETKIVNLLVKTKGIITVLRNLSIDNILGQYFDGWYTSQVVYKQILAEDIESWLPFDYILHDARHFEQFNKLCIRKLKQKQFYDYIRKIRDKDKRYSVMMIYFLFIHEGGCDCFNTSLMEGDLSNEDHEFYSSNELKKVFFLKTNFLFQLIPKKYRFIIFSYLNTAMTNYLYTLEEFEKHKADPKTINDARKKIKEQAEQAEQAEWVNKPIPELLIKDGEITEECTTEVCGFRLWGGTRRKKKKKSRKSRKYPKSLG